MARSNATRCIGLVLKSEGGFTDDKRDPGNWTGGKVGKGKLLGTNFGIAANSYPNEDIPNLTKARATALYKRDYWDKVGGDRLPSGLDYAVFDYAINSGVGRAGRELQRMFGANRVDGIVGEATLKAAEDCVYGPGGVDLYIGKLCDARLAFMRTLKTWDTFGKGWTKRVHEVRRLALAMAAGTKVSAKAAPEGAERNDKAVPADRKPLASGEAKAGVGAAIGIGGSQAADAVSKLPDNDRGGMISDKLSEVATAIEPATYYIEWLSYLFVALTIGSIGFGIYLTIKRAREG